MAHITKLTARDTWASSAVEELYVGFVLQHYCRPMVPPGIKVMAHILKPTAWDTWLGAQCS